MTIKGRQLFVGNLPFLVGWQDLKDLFRSAGNVQRANIMQNRDGRSKGHGIVLYATVADAQKAISTFDGYEWHGRKLEVREDRIAMEYPPPPPRTEGANALNNQNELPFRVRWQDLKDLFRKAGTVLRADVAMGYDNRSKGHGTVLFATLEDAKNAIAMFNNYNWQNRTLEVREDRGFVDSNNNYNSNNSNNANGSSNNIITNNITNVNNNHMNIVNNQFSDLMMRRPIDPALNQHAQSLFAPPGAPMIPPGSIFYGPRGIQAPAPNHAGRLLFVGNLPFNCQWQDLKDLFRNAGNIIRADVFTNYDGRSRGFGTVLFATPEDARNAVAMYNGYDYQGRNLRVHFDKFTLPNIPPHPHHPGSHPPPHLAVHPHSHPHHPPHPHHRPPPPHHALIPHSFHMGLPHPIHHFIAPTHLGPFSPPLTTPPPLTSPPPYPTNGYNPLAHHLAGTTTLNSSTNGNSTFQPDQLLSAQSQSGQFSGFGPIGKNHFVPMLGANASSLSGFGSVGATFPTNNSTGANGNGIVTTTTIGSNGIDSNFNSPSTNSTNDNNGIQIVAAVATHHLHHPHQQPSHTHHSHHHPGAIGSGIIGGINNGVNHLHQQQQLHNTNTLSHATGTNGTSSSSVAAVTVTNGLNGVTHNTSSTPNGVIDSDTTGAGLWNNSAANMLTTATTTTNGSIGTSGVMGIEMASLAAMGPVMPTATSQSVYVRNI
ncbi:6426_t:CDS:10 [Ambispora leptoticha]|uniref:6426_t:CDS:1 n=2 Tax=Ambispora leptoticha TaxID=144679 RepID=A0A9N8ZMD7_9GLOM|nr:6426_t:CDS:10 [Ambispora leptoticha]